MTYVSTDTLRYLTTGDVDYDLALRAEEIVEKWLGYQLAPTECRETLRYDRNAAGRLTHTPVISVLSVSGRINAWPASHRELTHAIGQTSWTPIDVTHTILHQKDDRAALVVPTSLYGVPYDELAVTYVAGVSPIPQDVLDAVQTVYEALRSGEMDEWNIALPVDVQDVLSRYRKEVTLD